MNIKKFYTGRTIAFLLVLVVVLVGAYMFKDGKTVTYDPPIAENTKEPVAISITKEEMKEENFTGTVAKISGEGELSQKTREYINERVSEFRTQADTEVPEMRTQFGTDSPAANYTIEIGATHITSIETESIVISIYSYTGGAHGNSFYRVMTASKDDGKILSLGEIIKKDTQEDFTAFVKKELKAWQPAGAEASPVFPEDVDALVFDSFKNWSLDDKNLTIYFSQYEIGPGVLGPVAFPLAFAEIKDFLK